MRNAPPPAPACPAPHNPLPGFHPSQRPRRTEAAARAEAERLAASPPAVGDFLDVRCPDYRWRAGQVTSVQFSPDPATPERAVITCEITCMTGSSEEPTSVQFIHSAQIGSLDFAPHSQYSDVTIHEYSAVSQPRIRPRRPRPRSSAAAGPTTDLEASAAANRKSPPNVHRRRPRRPSRPRAHAGPNRRLFGRLHQHARRRPKHVAAR